MATRMAGNVTKPAIKAGKADKRTPSKAGASWTLMVYLAGGTAVTAACAEVKAAVAQMVLKSGWKGAGMSRSNGASMYFPKKKVCGLYRAIDFGKKNAWARFINACVAAVGSRAWG